METDFKKGLSLYSLSLIFGSRICHQRNDRSFYFNGKKFPVCARCSGIYLSMLFGITFSILMIVFELKVYILYSFILAIPLLVDGLTQLLSNYESNNRRRLITGIMFGIPYGTIPVIILYYLLLFFK